MRPASSYTGFTLIELVVTVAVLAILLGVAVPAFQDTLAKRRLVGAAEQLYADLQYARSEAIKRNASVVVSFSTGTDWCYGIALATCACGTPGSCQLDGVEKVVSSSNFRGVSLPSADLTFSGEKTTFDPRRGTANNGTASLTSSSIGTVKVIVSTPGRVRICSDNVAAYKPSSGTCPP